MRFLIVDDSPYDRELIIRKIQKEFADATFVEVIQWADLEQAIIQPAIDMVLVDYRLKWANGLEILRWLRARFPEVPVIMVTDTGNEEIATEGMKMGLNDYVLKRHLHRLPIAVKECLEKVRLRAERNMLEEQVRQAQKMESLGLLVSGITHEFNNLLTGITGYADRGLSRANQHDPLYKNLSRIRDIAERAKHLTRQLLTFSRHQNFEPIDVNLNVVITNLLEFLGKILGNTIHIEFHSDPGLQTIFADPTQLEQVLVNLCINSRDAMSSGGTVLIKTQNVVLEEQDRHRSLNRPPGAYVLLSVADTGVGIEKHIQERIFEPFFTTKEADKGTGLGLSVVYGIIGQHQGFVTVESEVEHGTTFNIYLPVSGQTKINTEASETQVVPSRAETILLVEDDPDLRLLMEDILQECGYTVLVASDGMEAWNTFNEHASSITLVIADMTMPQLSGKELYETIRNVSRTTRFLLVSGHQRDKISQNFAQDKGFEFLQKPFDLDELIAKVRNLKPA